LVTLTDL